MRIVMEAMFSVQICILFIPKHFDVKIAYLDSAAFTIKKY